MQQLSNYEKAIFETNQFLRVVLVVADGSVFTPDALRNAVSAGKGTVSLVHRDGRRVDVNGDAILSVSPGQSGEALEGLFFPKEAPMAVLESRPDPELGELKEQVAELHEVLQRVSMKVDAQATEMKALTDSNAKSEGLIAKMAKELELLKTTVKASVESILKTGASVDPADKDPK